MRIKTLEHPKVYNKNVIIKLIETDFVDHERVNQIKQTKFWLLYYKNELDWFEWGELISCADDCSDDIKNSVWDYFTFQRCWLPTEYKINDDVYVIFEEDFLYIKQEK